MAGIRLLLFLALFSSGILVISSLTDPRDAAALQSLKDVWKNLPPSWGHSDPCGAPWEGVTCNDSRVTELKLSTMGLEGKLSGDIGELTELRSLDLSFNPRLTGYIPRSLGNLQKLNLLILTGCSFSGDIPDELGNLAELFFLALNSNNLTGKIPPSLGKLSKLYWLDLANNQLIGSLPISTSSNPGLDLLLKAKHFHFNKNQLSGSIPAKLFSSEMVLIHILFDENQLSGSIPSTLGLVQTVEALRLDRNALTGEVPSNLGNLTKINELNLAHNNLIGALPDLTQLTDLNYVDLSNNSFDPSEAPVWFSTLPSLVTLIIEYGSLKGAVPQKLFNFPKIRSVKLKNNTFNGTLNMGKNIGPQLHLVDLENNDISSIRVSPGYTQKLILIGNPICTTTNFCQLQHQPTKPYSTSLAKCGSKSCPPDQKLSPQSCECAYPYAGTLHFMAPTFWELSNVTIFNSLEMSLWEKLGLTPGSVSIQTSFGNDDSLQVQLELFPAIGKSFNKLEIQRIGFDLSDQTYKPPPEFGPYFYIASPYAFPGSNDIHSTLCIQLHGRQVVMIVRADRS